MTQAGTLPPVRYGFLGSDFAPQVLSKEALASAAESALGVRSLIVLNQVHGSTVARFASVEQWNPMPEADAVVCPVNRDTQGVALGIFTADCVPLLFYSREAVAAVHAGWRGLAAGVIEETFQCLAEYSPSEIQIFIGPAAGAERYEVGPEVIEALGARAKYTTRSGSLFLNLQETAQECVRVALLHSDISHSFEIIRECTISSSLYHSHRRDGARAGRNLSYIVVPSLKD